MTQGGGDKNKRRDSQGSKNTWETFDNNDVGNIGSLSVGYYARYNIDECKTF